MSASISFDRATVADFDELMDVLLECFKNNVPNHGRFENLYPDIYHKDAKLLAGKHIARDNGRIVAHVGVFDIPTLIDDRCVNVGGIGAVGVLPDYRKLGLMGQLMDRAVADMVAGGVAISWLWGDRLRYMPWGYELNTSVLEFVLNRRSPGFADTAEAAIAEVRADDDAAWAMLWKQAQQNPKLAIVGEKILRLKYKRQNYKIIASESAHIVMHAEHGQLEGWGGSSEGLPSVLKSVMLTLPAGHDSIRAKLPWYPDPYCAGFKKLMTGYAMINVGSLAIFNVVEALKIYQKHLATRAAQFGVKGRVALKIGPALQVPAQSVTLEVDGAHINIKEGLATGVEVVEMSRIQLSELLFTPLVVGWSVRLPQSLKWLTELLPLPMYFPHMCTD